jgi:hypothetical protein
MLILLVKLPCSQELIIEVAVPLDKNVTAKAQEKVQKCTELANKIMQTDRVYSRLLPVVVPVVRSQITGTQK